MQHFVTGILLNKYDMASVSGTGAFCLICQVFQEMQYKYVGGVIIGIYGSGSKVMLFFFA